MNQSLLEIGVVGIALLFLIKELFAYLKTRNDKGEGSINKQLLEAITEQNENHLKSIQGSLDAMRKDINTGNDRIVDSINTMHTDLASRLGELKGSLKK